MRKDSIEHLTDQMRQRHAEQHMPYVRRMGAEDADRGLPRLTDDQLRRYIEPILTPYRAMQHEVLQRTGAAANGPEGRSLGEHVRSRMAGREERMKVLGEGQRKLGVDHRRLAAPTYNWRNFKWLVAALIILVAGQWGFDLLALLSTGMIGPVLGFSLAIAVASAWSAHAAPKLIAKGRTPRQRWVIALALLAANLTVFAILSMVRSHFLASGPTTGHYNPPPWQFTVINAFIWFIEVVIMLYWPTREQWLARSEERTLRKNIERTGREIAVLQRANEVDREDLHARQLALYREMVEVRELLSLIATWSREACLEYMRENVLKRSDGGVPTCFDEEIPDLADVTNEIPV